MNGIEGLTITIKDFWQYVSPYCILGIFKPITLLYIRYIQTHRNTETPWKPIQSQMQTFV